MEMKRKLMVLLLSFALCALAGAGEIPVVNPGFELPAITTNTWNWNDRDATGVDVITGWSHDVDEDTGTWAGDYSEGSRSTFVLGGGASGPYQDLGYSIVAGGNYVFTMDVKNTYGYNGTGVLTFNAHDGAGRTEITTLQVDFATIAGAGWTSQSLSFTALAGEDYIGKSLGIEFNTLADGAGTWHGYDNVSVSGPTGTSASPTLDYPVDEEYEPPLLTLEWQAPQIYTPDEYYLYLDPNEDIVTAAVNGQAPPSIEVFVVEPDPDHTLTAGSFTPPQVELQHGVRYYWMVEAKRSYPGEDPNYFSSVVATFTTLPDEPIITEQPQDLHLVEAGTDPNFTVAAINPETFDATGLSYQWYLDADPDVALLESDPNYNGTTTTTLTFPAVDEADEGLYFCRVTIDATGDWIDTRSASLGVYVKSLLAQWNFEGNVDDDSGNGHHGSLVGTPEFPDPLIPDLAVTGKALKCVDGSGEYVEVPADLLSEVDDQITISLWVNGDNQPNPGNDPTFFARDGGIPVILCLIPHSTSRLDLRTGNPDDGYDQIYSSIPSSWYKDKWNHWVITKDTNVGVTRVYVNGIPAFEQTGTTKAIYGATQFTIGGSGTNTYDGLIDDFRIYNYVLTPAEITAISPRPMLPEPADGAVNVPFDTNLKWTPGDGVTKFKAYYGQTLDPDPNVHLVNPTEISGLTEPDADPGINFDLDSTYYWYVREYNAGDELIWTSDLWDFQTVDLITDLDGDSKVNNVDYAMLANRWREDVRGVIPSVRVVDSCVYDPANQDAEDPESYAHYWETYYTYTEGNLLYGDGTCAAIDDPNKCIEWTYDTPSSTGGTDCDFIYWHRNRTQLALRDYGEMHVEMKAMPGATMNWALWMSFWDKDGDAVSYNLGTGPLGDNEWHDMVIPLGSLADIGDMDDLEYIHAGMWSPNLSGVWLIKNMRVVLPPGTVGCIPEFFVIEDINNDCFINMADLELLAIDWLTDASNP